MLKHWGLAKPADHRRCRRRRARGDRRHQQPRRTARPRSTTPTSWRSSTTTCWSAASKTKGPIDITIRPLACTATIMHDLMGADAARLPREIKGAMLSCILSDTLEFRSPTTTPHDRAVAEKLAADLGVSIPDLAAEHVRGQVRCLGLLGRRTPADGLQGIQRRRQGTARLGAGNHRRPRSCWTARTA